MGEKEGKDENKKENKANRGGDNNNKNKEEGGGGGGGGAENKNKEGDNNKSKNKKEGGGGGGENKNKNKGGDNNNKNKEEGGGGEKKKEEGPISVVLKVDIHCEGCALKIKKSVKNFEGVDAVSTDMANNKVTVVGKVDPWKIRERVESKTRKKVDLISPANPPKKDAEPKKAQSDSKDKTKPDDGKTKEPAVSTVVLKIRLHCEGCIRRIRRTILRIKGVETASIDSQKDLVTVKGTMDPNALPSYLKDKLKRSVEIVPQKKEPGGGGGSDKKEKSGDGDRKDKGGGDKKAKEGGGGDKKEGGKKDSDGDKKEGGKKDSDGGDQKQEAAVGPAVVEASKMEYYGGPYGYGSGGVAPIRIEMVHAPQLFSDENPNACSVM